MVFQAPPRSDPGAPLGASETLCILPGPCGFQIRSRIEAVLEQALLRALQRPAFNIAGFRRADLIAVLTNVSATGISRQLQRLRHLGLIKRVAGTYASISLAPDALPSPPVVASPKTPSFRLPHDKICSQKAKTQLIRD